MSNETENNCVEEKAAYAALLLKERDPFKAALCLFPNNTNRALWVASNWPKDEKVLLEQKRILETQDECSLLHTKADLAQAIWDKMEGFVKPDEYARLAKLYAELMGFIEKPQTSVNVNNFQRVVEVPVFRDEADWESAAAKQQMELLAHARNRH